MKLVIVAFSLCFLTTTAAVAELKSDCSKNTGYKPSYCDPPPKAKPKKQTVLPKSGVREPPRYPPAYPPQYSQQQPYYQPNPLFPLLNRMYPRAY